MALIVGAGVLTFHPTRPLYMRNTAVEFTAADRVVLRGTVSIPRWSRKPVPLFDDMTRWLRERGVLAASR